MSTHPNTMILGILVPDDLTRKTFRAILAEAGVEADDPSIKIDEGTHQYSLLVMESDYNKGYQISAPEGSIVAHKYLTYGYGETIPWSEVEEAKAKLDEWLRGIAKRHKCAYSIHITANYW